MSKESNVIEFYVLCNKLKNVVRTGWIKWGVNKERVESIAEHIYGTQMLAIAMYSEYNYDLDLKKVLFMLACHELEEILIGDLTPYEISKEEKEIMGHKAVKEVLKNLMNKEDINSLVLEFDARVTKEALFAYHIDKLECDLQCKLYDEEKTVDLKNQESNPICKDERVQYFMNKENSWSSMWIECDRYHFKDDKNFESVLDYAKNNKIGKQS